MAPIAVMGVMAIAPVFGGFAWLSAGVAAWLSGHGFTVPRYRYGIGALTAVAKGRTAGPRPLTLAVAGVLVLLPILLLVLLGRKVRAWSRERAKTATARAINARADVDGMRPAQRAREAARLHPELATQLATAQEQAAGDEELERWLQVVYLLGSVYPQGPAIQPGWEDVELAFMAPRSGKTTALAIPKLLAAPGAAVGTANKPDLYLATCTGARSAAGCGPSTRNPSPTCSKPSGGIRCAWSTTTLPRPGWLRSSPKRSQPTAVTSSGPKRLRSC